jgi:hypothetical protein
MPSPTTRRTFKPALEYLEERELPTTVVGNVQALGYNLNVAANTFLVDQAVLAGYQPFAPSGGSAAVSTQYAKVTADYQQMLNDQSSIQKRAAADIALTNYAAATNGNPQLVVLALLYIEPQIQNVVNQASATIGNASAQANQTYNFIGTLGPQPSIASQAGST